MKGILNLNNPFFRFMNRVADLIILNLLCIVCCLPVITIGPAITAMFYVTLKIVRNEECYVIRGFFHSFRDNLKQGILIHIIMVFIAAIIFVDMYFCWQIQANIPLCKILVGIFSALAVVYLMVFIYIYPLLARFSNTTKNMFINALLMSIRHLPQTIVMIILTIVPFIIMFSHSIILDWGLLLYALVGFSGMATLSSLMFVNIFDKYTPKTEHVTKQIDDIEIETSVFKNLQPTNKTSTPEAPSATDIESHENNYIK